jgi:hypothetical protein
MGSLLVCSRPSSQWPAKLLEKYLLRMKYTPLGRGMMTLGELAVRRRVL